MFPIYMYKYLNKNSLFLFSFLIINYFIKSELYNIGIKIIYYL